MIKCKCNFFLLLLSFMLISINAFPLTSLANSNSKQIQPRYVSNYHCLDSTCSGYIYIHAWAQNLGQCPFGHSEDPLFGWCLGCKSDYLVCGNSSCGYVKKL